MRFTASVSTPICRAASLSCAVARTAQPSRENRRNPNSTAALTSPVAAIRISSAPIVPRPNVNRQSGNGFGSARGSGEKISCNPWSSTNEIPIVASSGAIRADPASGRSPTRSIAIPSTAHPATTIAIVTGNGVCRYVAQLQPMNAPAV